MILRAVWLLMLLTVFTLSAAAQDFKVGDLRWSHYGRGKVIFSPEKVFTVIDNADKPGAGIVTELPVKPGQLLKFSGSFKPFTGEVKTLFVQAVFMPRKKIVQKKFTLGRNSDFRLIEQAFSVPSGKNSVRFYVYVQPGQSAFLLKDVSLIVRDKSIPAKKTPADPGKVITLAGKNWLRYSKGTVELDSDGVLTVVDNDLKNGAGIVTTFPVKPDKRLGFSAEFKAHNGEVKELFVQARFMPGKRIVQQKFSLKNNEDFKKIKLMFMPPAGCSSVSFYVYVHPGKSAFKLRNLEVGEMRDSIFDRSKVKKRPRSMSLSADTVLVLPQDGSADSAVQILQQSCGIKFKTVKNTPGTLPYKTCIVIGNRNNNQLISDLYDGYHLIADSYYPGRGGYQVRTLFNVGNSGKNYLLISGSDNAGTAVAVKRAAAALKKHAAGGSRLTLPFFWDVKISPDHRLPLNVARAHSFDESEGYGTGSFGWNVLARYMALFYATGDKTYARRFLELALRSTADACAVLAENKGAFKIITDPLAGPYHYNSVMMNLYWELIEDHDVFSDDERMKIVEGMYRQFLFWRDTSNGCGIYNIVSPQSMIGNRHQQWAAISLYTSARYLNKVIPDKEYIHSMQAAEYFFDSIKKYYYLLGEGGNLTWFPSGNEPVALFMLIAGWKDHAKHSGFPELYRALETLAGNRHGKRIRYYMPLGLLRRSAYLLDDNAPLLFEKSLAEHFRVGSFRLGQSYAPPSGGYRNSKLAVPIGKWNFIKPSELEQKAWQIPFADRRNAFSIASWRADNDWGDLIIIDGHLDKIMRQPPHAMTIFTLCLNKLPLIAGYRNQLWAQHEGLSYSSMPGNAHLDSTMSLPDSAGFTSSLDISHTLSWQRSLLKVNDFCLIADTLTEKSSQDKKYSIDAVWEHAPDIVQKLMPGNQIRLISNSLRDNSVYYIESLSSDCSITPADGVLARLSGSVPSLLFKANRAGEKLQVNFSIDKDFNGKGVLRIYAYTDRGFFNVYLDGKSIKRSLCGYSMTAKSVELDLGDIALSKGRHFLTLEAAAPGKNGSMSIAFSALALQKGNQALREGSMTFSDPASVRLETHKESAKDLLSGIVSVYTYQAELKSREMRTYFTLIAARPAENFAVVRLADNAALLKLPEKALAVRGKYAAGNIDGELTVLSEKFLSGSKVINASGIFTAREAVDIKWDFTGGKVEIFAYNNTSVTLNGKVFKLKPGLNTLHCRLPQKQLHELQEKLALLVPMPVSEPQLVQNFSGKIKKAAAKAFCGKYPASLIVMQNKLAITAGKEIKLYDLDLKEVQTFTADAQVGKLAYAVEGDLLLAGCEDGKIIAFDPVSGERKWEHISREADGLSETGAHWYLKSAFPGIYGLKTGNFVNGQENIFAGSASTLEVLDNAGKLLRREKILWGPVQHFELLDIDGKKHLLMSQLHPGADYLTRLDTAFVKKIGYSNPPAGCLTTPSWMGINRTNITAVDLNGDGEAEVISGLNGIWNRIVIWDKLGKPLYEASFGPGDSLKAPLYGRERMSKRFLYDTVVIRTADRSFIAAATARALILFDAQLRKIWSKPLPAEPTFTVADNGIIVCGLRNGQLCFFNLKGKLEYVFNNKNAWAFLLIKDNDLFAADSQGNIYKFKLK